MGYMTMVWPPYGVFAQRQRLKNFVKDGVETSSDQDYTASRFYFRGLSILNIT